MLSFLHKHPFAIDAFFERSFVLTFALPKEQLLGLIPECLDLDTLDNKRAFLAIAMVDTKQLRPKGLPAWIGKDFFLIGYRIFTRYRNSSGRKLRGLYILKSETNKKTMEFGGNIFTSYRYHTTDITIVENPLTTKISSEKSKFVVEFSHDTSNIQLPKDSPFENWKEARRFAGPLPFTFSFNAKTKEVLVVEGVRTNWVPEPVRVLDYNFSFLENEMFKNAVLANAFLLRKVPYSWKKGLVDVWSAKESSLLV